MGLGNFLLAFSNALVLIDSLLPWRGEYCKGEWGTPIYAPTYRNIEPTCRGREIGAVPICRDVGEIFLLWIGAGEFGLGY